MWGTWFGKVNYRSSIGHLKESRVRVEMISNKMFSQSLADRLSVCLAPVLSAEKMLDAADETQVRKRRQLQKA